MIEPQIKFVCRRENEQMGIFAGQPAPECPLLRWYAEAEWNGVSRSGEGETELEARTQSITNVKKFIERR